MDLELMMMNDLHDPHVHVVECHVGPASSAGDYAMNGEWQGIAHGVVAAEGCTLYDALLESCRERCLGGGDSRPGEQAADAHRDGTPSM